MRITEIPLALLVVAGWNSNRMNERMLQRLRTSIKKYGLLGNLVVRRLVNGSYEVLSGNQRLKVLQEMNVYTVPCVVVEVDDAHARLLAQALNHIRGEDDFGLQAESVREILRSISAEEVLSILPETATSLKSLADLGKQPVDAYLKNWQQARSVRLRHLQFQLAEPQLEVVEKALNKLIPEANKGKCGNPNTRGTALYLLCKSFIEREESK